MATWADLIKLPGCTGEEKGLRTTSLNKLFKELTSLTDISYSISKMKTGCQ